MTAYGAEMAKPLSGGSKQGGAVQLVPPKLLSFGALSTPPYTDSSPRAFSTVRFDPTEAHYIRLDSVFLGPPNKIEYSYVTFKNRSRIYNVTLTWNIPLKKT